MFNCGHGVCTKTRLAGVVMAVAASMTLLATCAYAEDGGESVAAQSARANLSGSERLSGGGRAGERPLLSAAARVPAAKSGRNIRRPPGSLTNARLVVSWGDPASVLASSSALRRRSTGRKVAGAVIGAVGGFFAGVYLGAAIEGNRCNCDDPGLKGALIGAPIGAAVGGILGSRYF